MLLGYSLISALGQLNRQIQFAALSRVFDLPIVLQVELGQPQVLPGGDSCFQGGLILSKRTMSPHSKLRRMAREQMAGENFIGCLRRRKRIGDERSNREGVRLI